jgi:hypothetical protein
MKLQSFSTALLLCLHNQFVSVHGCSSHSHDHDHDHDHRHLADKKIPECGARVPTKEQRLDAGKAVANWRAKLGGNGGNGNGNSGNGGNGQIRGGKASNRGGVQRYLNAVSYQIPVTFHVIRKDNGDGDVSDTLIDQYIDHLNNEFTGSPFSFVKVTTNRVDNSAWNDCNSDTHFDGFGPELHVGGIGDMNVYFCNINSGSGGWAYYPNGGTAGQHWDGIVLESNYTKYGYSSDFVRRTVLPHEAG